MLAIYRVKRHPARWSGGDAAKQRAYDTILSRQSLDEMWRAVVPLDKARPNDGAMGLSFFVYTHGAERIIGHTREAIGRYG